MGDEGDGQLLEDEFLAAVLRTVEECRRLNCNPTAFMAMIHDHGALGAVKRLLRPPVEVPSDGFTRLWEMKRLDLAMEYIVAFNERFAPLFTEEERRIAQERLAVYGKTGP